jgi:hypothetical protein
MRQLSLSGPSVANGAISDGSQEPSPRAIPRMLSSYDPDGVAMGATRVVTHEIVLPLYGDGAGICYGGQVHLSRGYRLPHHLSRRSLRSLASRTVGTVLDRPTRHAQDVENWPRPHVLRPGPVVDRHLRWPCRQDLGAPAVCHRQRRHRALPAAVQVPGSLACGWMQRVLSCSRDRKRSRAGARLPKHSSSLFGPWVICGPCF